MSQSWLKDVYARVLTILKQPGTREHFGKMAIEWINEVAPQQKAYDEWKHERNARFLDMYVPVGPPQENMVWDCEYFMKPNLQEGAGDYGVVSACGWIPAEWSMRNLPKIEMPLPLPHNRSLSLLEKYAVLTALFNYCCAGVQKLNPLEGNGDIPADAYFGLHLLAQTGISYDDGKIWYSMREVDASVLNSYVDDVESDLLKNLRIEPQSGNHIDVTTKADVPSVNRGGLGASSGGSDCEPLPPRRFDGGTIRIFTQHVEICGVTVPFRSKRQRNLMILLTSKRNGRFCTYSGAELAQELRIAAGATGVGSTMRSLREKIQASLKGIGIESKRTDVIVTSRQGYCLSHKLSVQEVVDSADQAADTAGNENVATDRDIDVAKRSDNVARMAWICEQLRHEQELRVANVIERFGCNRKTAQRDFDKLIEENQIERVGSAAATRYRLLRN